MSNTAREVILKRQETVTQAYFELHLTAKAIGDQLGWDERTIWNDINQIRKRLVEKTQAHGDDYLFSLIQRKQSLIQDAQKQYGLAKKTQNQKEIRAWLYTIQGLDRELADLLTRTGIIKTAPIRNENVNINVPLTFQDVDQRIIGVLNARHKRDPDAPK